MDEGYKKSRSSELRILIIAEINKLIFLIEKNSPFIDIVEKRSHIRSVYEQLDKKEREEFNALFGENFLQGLLEHKAKDSEAGQKK